MKHSVALLIIAMYLQVVSTIGKEKPGDCPPPPDFGICVMMCENDDSCDGEKKCVCTLIINNKDYLFNEIFLNLSVLMDADSHARSL
jgi:hypothetical protein